MFFDFKDGADMGMRQRGCRLGLQLKSLFGLFVPDQLWGQKLGGHTPFELDALSLLDNAHAAFPETWIILYFPASIFQRTSGWPVNIRNI